MALRFRRRLRRFWIILDAEGVALFQTVVYLHIAISGVYGLAFAQPPQVVEASMGPVFDAMWLWLCVGTALAVIGRWLPTTRAYPSMLLQLAGDVFTAGVFSIYMVAVFNSPWWGHSLFTVFLVGSLTWCVLLLIVRDVRRLLQVESRVRA